MKTFFLAATAFAFASPLAAQIAVDGARDAAYGSATASVATDPAAPIGNFGAPSDRATAGYDIFLTSSGGDLYGFMQQTGGVAVAPFANLYFDLDPVTRSGSDLGFELSQSGARAFIPGVAGFVDVSDQYSFASTVVNGLTNLEFRLSNSLFAGPIAGLSYNPAVTFGNDVRLNLSQSLSYSVAGGQAAYGNNRLGVVSLSAAVPEPSAWALMILGMGIIGAAMRSRRNGKIAFA